MAGDLLARHGLSCGCYSRHKRRTGSYTSGLCHLDIIVVSRLGEQTQADEVISLYVMTGNMAAQPGGSLQGQSYVPKVLCSPDVYGAHNENIDQKP